MRTKVVIVTAALLSLSCGTPTAPDQSVVTQSTSQSSEPAGKPARARGVRNRPAAAPLVGSWGGEHIGLDLQVGVSRVELDCAHGTIDEAIIPAADGTFEVRGTFTLERGGPITDTDVENIRPARYRGKISGGTMDLTIIVDGTALSEAFVLVRDQFPRIVKCL
jgi:hypothetical protein